MKMGMIVDDAEEFPCGDGLRDRAVIQLCQLRNHSQGVTVLSSTQTSGTMCHS